VGKFAEGTRLIAAANISEHDVVCCLKTSVPRAGVKTQWSHSTRILYCQPNCAPAPSIRVQYMLNIPDLIALKALADEVNGAWFQAEDQL
jgi:hypothetical protein